MLGNGYVHFCFFDVGFARVMEILCTEELMFSICIKAIFTFLINCVLYDRNWIGSSGK